MSYRKFFSGDLVQVTSHLYGRHLGHIGQVNSTRIKVGPNYHKISYVVACECGMVLHPAASYVDRWRGPAIEMEEIRLNYFFRAAGIPPGTMQLDELLSPLKEREKEILFNRFGLCGRERKTLHEIAKERGLSRERIRQIEAHALEKLR